jgi:O-glycosyl hydrolase
MKSWLATLLFFPILPGFLWAQPKPVLIQPQIQLQRMEGFGVSLANGCARQIQALPPTEKSRLVNLLFGAEGARFNIVRTEIYPTGKRLPYTHPLYLSGLVYSFAEDENETAQFQLLREILKKGEILLNPCVWSPPASWKNTSSLAAGELNPDKVQDYAVYLFGYLNFYRTLRNLPFHILTLQNDPTGSTPGIGCSWSPERLKDFSKALEKQLKQKGVTIRFMLPDTGWEKLSRYVEPHLADKEARELFPALSAHSGTGEEVQGREAARDLSRKNSLKLWQTEYASPAGAADTIEDGLRLAATLLADLNRAECTAWSYATVFPVERNPALAGLLEPSSPTWKTPRRFWCLSQFSRYLTRDYVHVSASGGTSLLAAFRNPMYNSMTIVLANLKPEEVQETLELRGWMLEGIQLYRTSAKEDCQAVSAGLPAGSRLVIPLAPSSVTTLVAQLKRTNP